ncbi:MAG TPA: Clp protease N-terminal domain-containing protein [Candidatus Baltobacteraceae bacterium]
MSMWEPFTESARRSVVLAQEAAELRGSGTIDGRHLLYGIVAEGQSPTAIALRTAGVTKDRLGPAVGEKRAERHGGQMIFTPDAKRAIEAAFREARVLNHNFVGTAHLALGAMDAPKGSAAESLHAIGADLADLRRLVTAAAKSEVPLPQPAFAIDHVQIAIPKGGESQARGFYGGLIGLPEIEKPAHLRANGGVWFGCGPVQLHLGVDPAFSPSKKAHVALSCSGYDEIVERLRGSGHAVTVAPEPLPSGAHAYVDDPFGNRLELVAQPSR